VGSRAERVAVGVDLGGTNLTGLLVSDRGTVAGRELRATPAALGAEAVLGAVLDVASGLAGQARELGHEIAGVGLGIPGPVDADRGVCLFSPNLGWRDLDVISRFREVFNVPVRIDNDVRAATLGEAWLGAGHPYRTFVCLTVGTGIGSGLVLDGRLWRGPGYSAGELGHIPVVDGPDAPPCGCGRRGCLEAVASGTAIGREGRRAASRGEPTSLARLPAEDITARVVAEHARAGDATAARVLRRAAVYLGLGIATAVNLLNPEAVIVGGRVSRSWDLIQPEVTRVVSEKGFPPNLLFLRGVFPAELGEDAGAIGAASLVLGPGGGAVSR